jgi:hypothetical protein
MAMAPHFNNNHSNINILLRFRLWLLVACCVQEAAMAQRFSNNNINMLGGFGCDFNSFDCCMVCVNGDGASFQPQP